MELFKQNFSNLNRIWGMAILSVKEEFRGANLGVVWEIIRTLVFFLIYGMFFVLIKGKSDSNIILGLFSTLLPWQFVSAVINQTPRVYRKKKLLVTSIKFPIEIIPTFDILSKVLIHFITTVIVLIIFAVFNKFNIFYFQLIYYYIALSLLLLGIMTTLSIICSISVDAYKMWQVLTRVFIYLNPIFWSIDTVTKLANKVHLSWVIYIIKANPFVYIFEGFRGTMLRGEPIQFSLYMGYFWLCVIGFFALGAYFQSKTRRILPDVL